MPKRRKVIGIVFGVGLIVRQCDMHYLARNPHMANGNGVREGPNTRYRITWILKRMLRDDLSCNIGVIQEKN